MEQIPSWVWQVLATAVVGLVLGWLNHQTHVMVNSRLTQLLAANSRADRAEGEAAGGVTKEEIKRMIDEAMSKAVAIPPTVSPETLAAVISDHPAVVAVALTDTATSVAAELKAKVGK